jgi:hypothetical protein
MNVNVQLHPGTSSLLTMSGVKDPTGAIISDATVTASLFQPGSTRPVTALQSLALVAVNGTPGSYSARTAVLPADLAIENDYVLVLTITKAPDTTTYKKKVPVNLP